MPLYTDPKHFRMALRESGLFRVFSAMIAETDEDDLSPHGALYWYCSDHHGGQSCPLYALLSQSQYSPGILERECPEEFRHLYDMFVEARNK